MGVEQRRLTPGSLWSLYPASACLWGRVQPGLVPYPVLKLLGESWRQLPYFPFVLSFSRSMVLRTAACLFSASSCTQQHLGEEYREPRGHCLGGQLADLRRRASSSPGSVSLCRPGSSSWGHPPLGLAARSEGQRVQAATQLLAGRNYLLPGSACDSALLVPELAWDCGSCLYYLSPR